MSTAAVITPAPKRGLTLVEVLAVVVVIALAAAVTAAGVASADSAAKLRGTAAALRDLDARARVLARSEGALVLLIDETRRLATVAAAGVEPVLSRELPRRLQVELRDAGGTPLRSVRIDRSGRSIDYQITVRQDGRQITLAVAGLTGWVEQRDVEEPAP